jgi:hypothetical protein
MPCGQSLFLNTYRHRPMSSPMLLVYTVGFSFSSLCGIKRKSPFRNERLGRATSRRRQSPWWVASPRRATVRWSSRAVARAEWAPHSLRSDFALLLALQFVAVVSLALRAHFLLAHALCGPTLPATRTVAVLPHVRRATTSPLVGGDLLLSRGGRVLTNAHLGRRRPRNVFVVQRCRSERLIEIPAGTFVAKLYIVVSMAVLEAVQKGPLT